MLIFIIIGGFFEPKISLLAIPCMVLPIVTSFFKARYYCNHICPRGSLYDNILSNNKRMPRVLSSNIFRILVIIIMFTVFGIGIKNNWGDIDGISLVFHKMVIATTSIGIFLSLFYNHRSWCAFCPMGSIASFISKMK